ncbi:hydrolase, partial [Candidatus Symbiopectobacterium sp. NZEC135]|nr:hydrolase [Candidatus Symbiopectobacterium sp. NZEC135]
KLFPESAVQGAYDKMHRVWKSQNADSKLETKMWPELGHVFYQEQQAEVFSWLDRYLMPKP